MQNDTLFFLFKGNKYDDGICCYRDTYHSVEAAKVAANQNPHYQDAAEIATLRDGKLVCLWWGEVDRANGRFGWVPVED